MADQRTKVDVERLEEIERKWRGFSEPFFAAQDDDGDWWVTTDKDDVDQAIARMDCDCGEELATVWAASTPYTSGDVVKNKGRFYRCITSGTSASSGGPGSVSMDITDGTAHWSGGETGFANGLFIVNMAPTGGQTMYWGFEGVTPSTGLPIYAGGGLSLSIADPTLVWVITATSTSIVGVAGLS